MNGNIMLALIFITLLLYTAWCLRQQQKRLP
jgi:cbb3-type cytochrome oxidase subunit 3